MKEREDISLSWIVVRQGDDDNWWVAEASDDIDWGREALSVLNPEQMRFITAQLEKYRADGYRRSMFEEAFSAWRVEKTLGEGTLRLVPVDASFFEDGAEVFALPDVPMTLEDEGEEHGEYYDFLETVEHLRIKNLNRTHHYAHEVDELEMEDELRAVDSDRYAYGEALHVFEEIREILEWSPEEWSNAEDAGNDKAPETDEDSE